MSDLKDLRKQEKQLRNTFEYLKEFRKQYSAKKNESELTTRIEMLDSAMKKFYVVRRKIELIIDETDEKELSSAKESPEERAARLEIRASERDAENAAVLKEFEDLYCNLKSSLKALLPTPVESKVEEVIQTSVVPGSTNKLSQVKLPEIRLPNFGGRTRDWVTFRDMFQSLIHENNQLTVMDKFSYLRSALTGEALQ